MADILIRDVPEEILEKLKKLAKSHNRSLQQELKNIIVEWAEHFSFNISKRASTIKECLKSKKIIFTDSTKLIRKDRSR